MLTTGWLMSDNKSTLLGLRALIHITLGVSVLFLIMYMYMLWIHCTVFIVSGVCVQARLLARFMTIV